MCFGRCRHVFGAGVDMFSGCVAKQQQGEKGKQNEVKRNKRGKLLLHVSLSRLDPKTTWTWSAAGTPPALVVGGE